MSNLSKNDPPLDPSPDSQRTIPNGNRTTQGKSPAAQPETHPVADTFGVPKHSADAARVPIENYEVLEQIGRGGMGVVYRARQLTLNRIVALKMILAGTHADHHSKQRFLREAEAAASLQHPHIVPVYDMGQSHGQSYFAMEYVEGSDLQEAPSTSPRDAADLMRRVAEAIHYAHSKGIIHRDLKPANILIDAKGMPRVTDFGLAKVLSRDEVTQLTGQDQLMGTAPYMPPEQARGDVGQIGPAADIYSLGAILYQLLTTQPPFIGKSTYEVLRKVQHDEPWAPSRLADGIPRDLETICLKCLEKEPHRRYATAEELATDLQRFLDGEPISAARSSTVRRATRYVRRTPAAQAAVLVGAILLGMAGWKTWDYVNYYRPTHELFANVQLRDGTAEGVGKLNPTDYTRRFLSYRIVRRGLRGPVIRVASENSAGYPQESAALGSFLDSQQDELMEGMPGVARLEFDWKADGTVDQMLAYDAGGNKQWAFVYTEWPTRGHFVGPDGYDRSRTGSGASHLELTYDEAGLLSEVQFFDRAHRPQPNAVGTFGYRMTHDADQRTKTLEFLTAHGQPAIVYGTYKIRKHFDEQGNPVALDCLDDQDQLTICTNGFSTVTMEYDAYGNQIAESTWGTDGKPITGQGGAPRSQIIYDKRGFKIEERFYDVSGQLIAGGEQRVPICRFKHDATGRVIEESYLDANEQPLLNASGFARIRRAYDQSGHIVEESVYDAEDRPAMDADGVYRTTYAYDNLGNLLEVAEYDEHGNPTLNAQGWSRVISTYERDNLIAENYLDAEGNPTFVEEGYAAYRQEFDDRGNVMKITYLDQDGEPVVISSGEAIAVFEYDAYGNQIAESFYDAAGKPTLNTDGWHRGVYSYDEHNLQVRLALFDEHLQPTWHTDGYSVIEGDPDDRGNFLVLRHLDTEGQLTNIVNGYAMVRSKYDNRGNQIEAAYFDANERPVYVSSIGGARVRVEYDRRDNLIRQTTYDAHGRPVEDAGGVAIVENDYDHQGNLVERRFFDAFGAPTYGVARIVSKFDDRGNELEQAHFGPDGQPTTTWEGYSRHVNGFDRLGRRVEFTLYDEEGHRTLHNQGHSRIVRKLDHHGRLIKEWIYDEQDQLVVGDLGYAIFEAKYDHVGNRTHEAYFNPDESPRTDYAGVHLYVSRYERGLEVEKSHYGIDGQLTLSTEGYARVEYDYNSSQQLIAIRYFGINGEPAEHFGFSRVESEYDARGNRIRIRYYDASGSPVARQGAHYGDTEFGYGFATEKSKYDFRGHETESEVFDAEDNPTLRQPFGYWRIVKEFDERGHEVHRRLFGIDGEPVMGTDGYAEYADHYDTQGRLTGRQYYDDTGQLIPVLVKVTNVKAGARALDLRFGDLVLRYDGKPISDARSLARRLSDSTGTHQIEIDRDGERLTIVVPGGDLGIEFDDVLPGSQRGADLLGVLNELLREATAEADATSSRED